MALGSVNFNAYCENFRNESGSNKIKLNGAKWLLLNNRRNDFNSIYYYTRFNWVIFCIHFFELPFYCHTGDPPPYGGVGSDSDKHRIQIWYYCLYFIISRAKT